MALRRLRVGGDGVKFDLEVFAHMLDSHRRQGADQSVRKNGSLLRRECPGAPVWWRRLWVPVGLEGHWITELSDFDLIGLVELISLLVSSTSSGSPTSTSSDDRAAWPGGNPGCVGSVSRWSGGAPGDNPGVLQDSTIEGRARGVANSQMCRAVV